MTLLCHCKSASGVGFELMVGSNQMHIGDEGSAKCILDLASERSIIGRLQSSWRRSAEAKVISGQMFLRRLVAALPWHRESASG